MICHFCREPLETVQGKYDGLTIVADCIRPACVQAWRKELGGRRPAFQLSRTRPAGRVVRCLPGLCEPYAGTPPGQPPRCRHCEAVVPLEEDPHA